MNLFQTKRFIALVGIISAILINSCSSYYGPQSDHFDGSHFFNKEEDHSFSNMIKWLWEMETVEWPEWIEDPQQPLPARRVEKGSIRATFINHATVLIQMDEVNILTDPIWSLRAGPISWLGVKRVRAAGVKMDDLPNIDYVLISHDHYDHLDIPSLKEIEKRHHPKYLVGLGVKNILKSNGIDNVVELDWWQKKEIRGHDASITFVPAWHNSGRTPLISNKTLWGGFVISTQSGQVYFAGDTALKGFFHEIGSRFSRIKLAILPIGSYEKRWFMKNQHMNPDDAVQAQKILNANQSMGIHFGTFAEHPEQTIDLHEKDLSDALVKHSIPADRFWVLKFGEGRNAVMK